MIAYIVPLLVVIFGGYNIYLVYRQSLIRNVDIINIQTPLVGESIIIKTQEVNFDIESYPVMPGTLFLRNTSPVYYMDRQQIVVTSKRIILSAIVNGKEYAPKGIYFNSSDLSEDVLKFSKQTYLYKSYSLKKDQLQITTKEKKAFFPFPIYIVANFSKYPSELLTVLKKKLIKDNP